MLRDGKRNPDAKAVDDIFPRQGGDHNADADTDVEETRNRQHSSGEGRM